MDIWPVGHKLYLYRTERSVLLIILFARVIKVTVQSPAAARPCKLMTYMYVRGTFSLHDGKARKLQKTKGKSTRS